MGKKNKSPLSGLWLIGAITFDKNGIGTARVARTKTEARQRAEGIIAGAVYHWQKSGERCVKSNYQRYQLYAKRKSYDVNDFMRDIQSGKIKGASSSYDVRCYYIAKEGIWLTSPDGERIHITELRQKYLKEYAHRDKQVELNMKAMAECIKAGARDHAESLSKKGGPK